jgi:hypothetical protein
MACVLLLALALRVRAFRSYAAAWDATEYVWAVGQHYLPHSPYILYEWLGLALATILPADLALSLLSLGGGVASVYLCGALVRRQDGGVAAGLVASLALAVFPVCVQYSAVQEVYAVQGAFVLGAWVAVTRRGLRGSLLGGLLFGAAIAVHNGTSFLLPAFVVALRCDGRGPATRRMLAAAAAAGVMPAIAYGWVAWCFAASPAGFSWLRWLRYLRGIAPTPDAIPSLWPALRRSADLFLYGLRSGLGLSGVAVALLALSLVVLAARRPARAAMWSLYAAPYLAYEFWIGVDLDVGLWVPQVAPAVAATLALAGADLLRWMNALTPARVRAGIPATALGVAALAAFLPPARASERLGRDVPTRARFFARDLVAACEWIRTHTPAETVVVQPPSARIPGMIPAYCERRPVIFMARRYYFFRGSRWAPLNIDSYEAFDARHVDGMRAAHVPLLAFSPQHLGEAIPALRGLGWRRVSIPLPGAPAGRTIAAYLLAQ